MRCEFPPDSNTCRRCKSGGHQCIVEGRKPRSGPKYVPFSWVYTSPDIDIDSKREFLLAQLRQKEAIIDSLLKQINNPAHRTPLNLALPSQPAHSGTPEPAANKDVLAWIEKIQGASVRTAGAGGGAGAFSLDARAENDDTFDEEADDDDGAGAGDNDADQEADADLEQPEKEKKSKLHSLPEEAAPLGLIANLSLRNTTPRKPSMGTSDAASPAAVDAASPDQREENENDVGVASATYFLPGLLLRISLHFFLSPPQVLQQILSCDGLSLSARCPQRS